jgi:hypothetical protein
MFPVQIKRMRFMRRRAPEPGESMKLEAAWKTGKRATGGKNEQMATPGLDRAAPAVFFVTPMRFRFLTLVWLGLLLALAGCASVPELGLLADPGTSGRKIVVRLKEQKAYLYHHGRIVAVSTVSTGREGYATPSGWYRVAQKDLRHRSSLYGAYVRDGRIVKANVNVKKDKKPAGAVFVGAPMPYFLRIHGAVGLHAGHVPGYPASHGCIRLPPRQARRFFYAVQVGTLVIIER